MLAKRGAVEQAEDALLKAVKDDPSRADAWASLAVLADEQGKFAQSETYYSKARSLLGDTAVLCCNRGYSYYIQRRWAEAEASLRQAITLDPTNRRAHNNLGLVLAHSSRPDEALAEFRSAGCAAAAAEANLALCLTLESSFDEARRHYQLALAADPESAVAREDLRVLDHLQEKMRPVASSGNLPNLAMQAPSTNDTGSPPAGLTCNRFAE
jgi:Tfp pilus assembly protein PilF